MVPSILRFRQIQSLPVKRASFPTYWTSLLANPLTADLLFTLNVPLMHQVPTEQMSSTNHMWPAQTQYPCHVICSRSKTSSHLWELIQQTNGSGHVPNLNPPQRGLSMIIEAFAVCDMYVTFRAYPILPCKGCEHRSSDMPTVLRVQIHGPYHRSYIYMTSGLRVPKIE